MSLPEHGGIVRPRALFKTYLYNPNENIGWSTATRQLSLQTATGRSLSDLFSALSLGDTTNNLSACYVAEVVSYALRKITPHDKNTTTLVVHSKDAIPPDCAVWAVGLRMYTGMDAETGKPEGPWEHTLHKEWFYEPDDLVPMNKIIAYERLKAGDFIKRGKGDVSLVLTNKLLKKPQFYKSNAWTSRHVTVLNKLGKRTRISPTSFFELVNAEPSLPAPTVVLPTVL